MTLSAMASDSFLWPSATAQGLFVSP